MGAAVLFAIKTFHELIAGTSMDIPADGGFETVGEYVELTYGNNNQRKILTSYRCLSRHARQHQHKPGGMPKDMALGISSQMKEADAIRREQTSRQETRLRPLVKHENGPKIIQHKLRLRTKKQSVLQQMPYIIRNVLVSSGKYMSTSKNKEDTILDWGFGELTSNTGPCLFNLTHFRDR